MDYLQTIIGGLLGGGLIGFVEFLIRRRDDKAAKSDEMLAAIHKVDLKISTLEDRMTKNEAKEDERDAVERRVRILRFADEMLEGRRHSKDSYDQCLSDITAYEYYCHHGHPDFKNNQTAATVEVIKASYKERLEKHDFTSF